MGKNTCHERVVIDFCARHRITAEQFYGKEKVPGSLDLSSLTSIPEGFSPTVGGYLYLDSLTSIPEGFSPTVGYSLDLSSLTSEERAKVSTRSPDAGTFSKMTWQGGRFALVDGVFSEVVSHRGNVYRTRRIGRATVEYLVTDGKGKWAHGGTLREARSDLIYKIVDRDTSKYTSMTVDSILSKELAIEAYRAITGACAAGVRGFVERLPVVKKSYTIGEIIDLTKGAFGNESFRLFFQKA